MKTLCPLLSVLLGTTLLAPTARSTPANEQPLTIAIFYFESKDEAVHDLGPKVATLLNANLSPDTPSKVGHLTGAKVLISGRVFKAQKRADEVLAVDRQTCVAADFAEQTPAKTALQRAVTERAERLVPPMAK